MAALLGYSGRFALVAGRAGHDFAPPATDTIEVVERLQGGSVTDYGALTKPIVSDRMRLTVTYRNLLVSLLNAAWATFDAEYAKVPVGRRGIKPKTGRSADGFRLHLFETDAWHLSAFGGSFRPPDPGSLIEQEPKVRAAIVDGVRNLQLGEPFAPVKRHGLEWTPLFAARRSIWHALDHAWQLEDAR